MFTYLNFLASNFQLHDQKTILKSKKTTPLFCNAFCFLYIQLIIKIKLCLSLFTDSKNRWQCMNNCGRSYKNKCDFNRHMRKECGVPPQYRCNSCFKMFKHIYHLKTHVITVHQQLFNMIK